MMHVPQRPKKPKKDTFKRLRAKQRHMETLQDIQAARVAMEGPNEEGDDDS
jgi:hypothetical protein